MEDSPVLYERHEGLGIVQDQHVAVIGCGGIGSWISLYLGLAGVRAMDIYDSDSITENNLNRFPLGRDKVGVNKAVAMAEHIQSLRYGVEVIPRQNFEPELHRHYLERYRWVIVTTDSLKSRRMVYDEVMKAGGAIGYIECGADGHHATVTFSPATFSTPDEENPGYRSVPVFVGPCTLAASVAAYYVLLNRPRDYEKTFVANWIDREEFSFTTIVEADEIGEDNQSSDDAYNEIALGEEASDEQEV